MAMDSAYRLLLVGPLESDHLRRLIRHLKKVDPSASISVLCWHSNRPLPEDFQSLLDGVYEARRSSGLISRIPIVRSAVARSRYRRAFRSAVRNGIFDIVNIHYPSPRDLSILPIARKAGSKVVLSPWGSDVLRVTSPLALSKLRRLYSSADHVTGLEGRFMDSVRSILGFDPGKILPAGFGSDTLDYIFEHDGEATREEAKRILGLEGSYTITCGYNGSEGQRHNEIIEAVAQVRGDLPADLTLLFPFTYGAKPGYKEQLDESLEKHGLKGVFFTDYLPLDKLLLLRKCTDMFVHVQPTDASSASIKEYIACGAKVLHGGWIVYDDLESGGSKPYFTVPSMETLPETIVSAFNAQPIRIPDGILRTIQSEGWKARIQAWDGMFKRLSED